MTKTLTQILIKVTGLTALVAGIGLIILGPAELACIPMYSEGGRFHLEGFGYGSLIYAVIIGQVIVYPLIGALLVVIGYGHIKGQTWTAGLIRGLALSWLIIGLPVMPVLIFLTFSFKQITAIPVVIVVGLIAYPMGPILVRRLYRSHWLLDLLSNGRSVTEEFESTVVRISLLSIGALAAIACILFRGVMPFFGLWLRGFWGITVSAGWLSATVILLALNSKINPKACIYNLAYTIGAILDVVITVITFDWQHILNLTYFASVEKEAMLNAPITGIHVPLTLLPSLIAILIWQLKHPVKKT